MHKIMIFGLAVDNMQIKQNGSWVMPPEGVQWKQDGVWMQGTIEWVQLGDVDFSGTSNGEFRYIGAYPYVEIPHIIKGVNVTSYSNMFNGTSARGVKSTNKNVTNMSNMFYGSKATSLDLSSFDTSSVEYTDSMFHGSQATIGYARTQADADKLNSSSNKPVGLTFIVK